MIRNDILERKEEILEWISQNQSKAFICRQLHCKPETLNSYLTKMSIEYKGNQSGKGIRAAANYKPAEEYIKGDCVQSYKLKSKLIREGIKEYKCEKCQLTEWLNEPIPLELHHKDGNHFNNELDNLVILCPNCHAKENSKIENNVHYPFKYNKKEEEQQKEVNLMPKSIIKNFCLDCGIEISHHAQRCKSCAKKLQKRVVENRPNREELKNLIRTQSFVSIAQQYGVSDNAIRKWCVAENLPHKKMEINNYSNEEWEAI